MAAQLGAWLTFLKTNAWIDQVGGKVAESWLNYLKPGIDDVSVRLVAIGEQALAAVEDDKQDELSGSRHFDAYRQL